VVQGRLLCELVKPTVDVALLGQPLQPASFTSADGGRSIYTVGMLSHVSRRQDALL